MSARRRPTEGSPPRLDVDDISWTSGLEDQIHVIDGQLEKLEEHKRLALSREEYGMAHRIKEEIIRLGSRIEMLSSTRHDREPQSPNYSSPTQAFDALGGTVDLEWEPGQRQLSPSELARSNKDQAMLSRAQQVLIQREQARDMLQNIALAMEDEEDEPAVAAPLPEPNISTLLDRSYRPKPAQLGQLEAAMKHVLQKRRERNLPEVPEPEPEPEPSPEPVPEPREDPNYYSINDTGRLMTNAVADAEEEEERAANDASDAKENRFSSKINGLISRRNQRLTDNSRAIKTKRCSQVDGVVLKKQVMHEVSAIIANRSPKAKLRANLLPKYRG